MSKVKVCPILAVLWNLIDFTAQLLNNVSYHLLQLSVTHQVYLRASSGSQCN
jgi:hypothetical protein